MAKNQGIYTCFAVTLASFILRNIPQNASSNSSHKILYDLSFRAAGEESPATLLARPGFRDPSHPFGMTGNIVTYETVHLVVRLTRYYMICHSGHFDSLSAGSGEQSPATLLARPGFRDPSHPFGMTGNIVTYEIGQSHIHVLFPCNG